MWLDFREKIGGNEEGSIGIRKKENVRSRLWGEIKGSPSVGAPGAFEKDVESSVRSELQCK